MMEKEAAPVKISRSAIATIHGGFSHGRSDRLHSFIPARIALNASRSEFRVYAVPPPEGGTPNELNFPDSRWRKNPPWRRVAVAAGCVAVASLAAGPTAMSEIEQVAQGLFDGLDVRWTERAEFAAEAAWIEACDALDVYDGGFG